MEEEEGEINDVDEWYEDTAFSCFWRNYNIANQWIRSRDLKPIVADLTSTTRPEVELEDNGYDGAHFDIEAAEAAVTKNDGSEDDQSVSEEYLEFIAETRKHQRERERLRSSKKSKKHKKAKPVAELTYQNITSVDSVFERSHVPVDINDFDSGDRLKKLQLQQWYGTRSAEIETIETNIQAGYDKFVEARQPSFWPETPLRLDTYFKK